MININIIPGDDECKKSISSLNNRFSDFETTQKKTNEKLQSEINQNTEDNQKIKDKISAVEVQTQQNTQEIKEDKKRIERVENKVFPTKEPPKTIYDFNSWKHYLGWPVFLILVGYIFKKVRRIRKRKVKITQNYLVEIRQIFQEWQLNMYASTASYVVGFYLIQQAINKWINPRISNWLVTQKLITLSVVCLIIGGGFYLDGLITSSLKTPLQRLSIKIENAEIEEKVKKQLLSKTQKVNELFKETLKRFGLLAVVGILTKLIAEFWNEHILTLLSYAVPLAGALKIIWEVDKSLKKLKLREE